MAKLYLACLIPLLIFVSACEGAFPESIPNSEIQNSFHQYAWLWNEKPKNNDRVNPLTTEKLNNLEIELAKRIFGQPEALKAVLNTLERRALGLSPKTGPIASMLFVGSTGVGKTQTAKEISNILFGNGSGFIKLNMAEYNHESSQYRLFGAPLGYAGWEAGGEFTELLRAILKQNSYAVILLDEFDQACEMVRKVFAQIFDDGIVTDGIGQQIDCRNCLFICTSNLCSQKILTLHNLGRTANQIAKEIESTLMNFFSPSLYNRLDTVVFNPLTRNVIEQLIKKEMDRILNDLNINLKIKINYDQSMIDYFMQQENNLVLGARPVNDKVNSVIGEVIINGIKAGYLSAGEEVRMFYNEGKICLRNKLKPEDFEFLCLEHEGQLNPPFNFENILNLESVLQTKVLGQEYAINRTVSALKRYAAGFYQKNAPIGAFLYIGPTGVGKTELAKELARQLLGSDSHLIRLDMSEYSESSTVTRLVGTAPGYINHDEGGQLTEALKKHPYAIVLLDEIEKAHEVVRKVFLQIFDEGYLTDSQGSVIDCRNVIFICTTNLAAEDILLLDREGYSEEAILDSIRPYLMNYLSPELYNRLEPAIFRGLSPDLMRNLVNKLLHEVKVDLKKIKNIETEFDESLIDFLIINGYDYELGARPLKRLIQQVLVTSIATAIISNEIHANDRIVLSYSNGKVIVDKI